MAAPEEDSPKVISETMLASLMTVPQPEHTFWPSSSTMLGDGQLGFGQVAVLGCVVGLGWGCGRGLGVGFGCLRVANRSTGGLGPDLDWGGKRVGSLASVMSSGDY